MTRLRYVKTLEQVKQARENNPEFLLELDAPDPRRVRDRPDARRALVPKPLEPPREPEVCVTFSDVAMHVSPERTIEIGSAIFGVHARLRRRRGHLPDHDADDHRAGRARRAARPTASRRRSRRSSCTRTATACARRCRAWASPTSRREGTIGKALGAARVHRARLLLQDVPVVRAEGQGVRLRAAARPARVAPEAHRRLAARRRAHARRVAARSGRRRPGAQARAHSSTRRAPRRATAACCAACPGSGCCRSCTSATTTRARAGSKFPRSALSRPAPPSDTTARGCRPMASHDRSRARLTRPLGAAAPSRSQRRRSPRYGVTASGLFMVRFDTATPGTLDDVVAFTGLQSGERIAGIDFRPRTGQLYGLGVQPGGGNDTIRAYVIDPATGAARARDERAVHRPLRDRLRHGVQPEPSTGSAS